MESAICEQCGARQPREWRAGELCTRCGGAVRAEQRCAGCSRWTPRAKFCRHCGAELLPPELYAAARMLLAAGVDRFSLAARTQALDPGQRDTLGAQYAAQAARAAWLVEEVRFCERSLLQRGWWERVDDELAMALPAPSPDAVGRLPPAGGLALEELFEHSSLHGTRALAAIALLREGKVRRPVIDLASSAVDGGDPRLEVEAVLALSSWRVWSAAFPDWRELRRRSEVATTALPDPKLRPWAAVAVALPLWRGRAAMDPDLRAALERLREPLGEALASAHPELRFDAALALGDEAGLEAALEGEDPERRELARWRLATVQGRRVPRLLREGTEEALRDVLRGLDPPFPHAVSEALLERAVRSGEQLRRDALGMIRRARYWDLPLEDRVALGQAVAREAERLRAPELLELLSWATTPRVQEYRAPTELLPEARPIQVAATAALARVPAGERKAVLQDADFDRWVAHAAPEDGLALDGWWEEPELYEALLSAHSRQNDYDRPLDPHALDLLMGLWDRGERKGALAPLLGRALRHNQGITHRDDITAALWRRFRERPEERAALMVAGESWKQNLYEMRDAEPPERSLDGGDPVAFFRLYAAVDPNARAVLNDALEKRGGEKRLLELVDAVFDLADAQVARRPFDMMLVVAPLSSAVGNASTSSRRTGRHAAAAARFQERWARFAGAMEAMGYGPDSEPSPRGLLEQVEVELRIIAREQERSRPAPPARGEPDRAGGAAPPNDPTRAGDAALDPTHSGGTPPNDPVGASSTAPPNNVARAGGAALDPTHSGGTPPNDPVGANSTAPPNNVASAGDAALDPTYGGATPPNDPARAQGAAPRTRLAPDIDLLPVDREPLGPAPIATLLDYVELLKQLSGGNPLEAFAQAGLDVAGWTRAANEWGAVLIRRPDAALRFAALLQAGWAPR